MLAAARTYLRPLAWYAGNALLTVLVLVGVMRLWRTSLDRPIGYTDDSLQSLVFAKTVAETGWYLDNPRLGAPGRMDLRLFPMSEGLHFLMLRGLAAVTGDPFVAYNLFIYLGFPLSSTAALVVFRRFGYSAAVGALASQLFAFLPYHLLRVFLMGHVFLGSYWLVPLAVWVVLRVYSGDATAGRRRQLLRLAAACAFSFVFAGGGVYYAFFYCFFLCLAGFRAAVADRRYAAAGAAAALVASTSAGVFVNIAPCLPALRAAHAERGAGLMNRTVAQADSFGLRVVQMLLPAEDHRLPALKQLKHRYNVAMGAQVNENDSASLGALGAAGFVALLVALVRRRATSEPADLWQPLAVLNVAGVLLGTVGGLGAVVSFAGITWIRAYNRVVVFLAFFALFALALLADRLLRAAPGGWRWGALGAFAALTALGLLDQSGNWCRAAHTYRRHEFESDRAFARAIEDRLPPGSSVFQLPCCTFPEHPMPTWASGYHLAKPYLHTRALRWSYGPNLLQPEWAWQEEVGKKPVPEMLAGVRAHGFAGVYIDRRGYPDRAAQLEAELAAALGTAPLVSDDGQCSFFPLTSRPGPS
jgi:phosphoglycerol transferase